MNPARPLRRFAAYLDALPMTWRNRLRLRYHALGTPLGRGERAYTVWAYFALDVRQN